MTGTVGRGAGALCNALAKMRGHAAEGPLVYSAILGARERQTVMFQLDHGAWRFAAHEFYRVLIAQPVRAFHGVVHVPAPIVLAHIAERGADAPLSGHGVAARGKDFADAG